MSDIPVVFQRTVGTNVVVECKEEELKEYEKVTKDLLLPIFHHLEKGEHYKAVLAISEMVGDDSLKPLISVIDKKKQQFDIMSRIMNECGSYSFRERYGEPKSKDPLLSNELDDEEKIWYDVCYRDDFNMKAPKKNFKTLFELIEKYPDLGRKKIVQMHFFGEYFGVNEITHEEIGRKGLGLAMLRLGGRFILSWNFEQNIPSQESRMLFYNGARLCYVDEKRNCINMKKSGASLSVSFTPFDTSLLDNKDELRETHLRSIYSVDHNGFGFPSLRKRRSHYDDYEFYDDEYEEDMENEKEKVPEKPIEDEDGVERLFKKLPNNLLHFFSYPGGRLGENLADMISKRRVEAFRKVLLNFPTAILSEIEYHAYKSWGQTPLFFRVINTQDEELIDLCVSGLGKASKLLCEAMYDMHYHVSGKGHSQTTPLVQEVYNTYSVNVVLSKQDISLSSEEKKELGIEGWEMESKVKKALGEQDSWEFLPPGRGRGNKAVKAKNNVDRKIRTMAKKYAALRDKKFAERRAFEEERRRKKNEMMKRMLFKLRLFLNWSSVSERGGFRTSRKNSFIERVIMDDNLEIAKYLIEELMVDRVDQEPIRRKLNYFHLDDLKVTGEKQVNKGRRRLGLIRKGREPEFGRFNKTYRYVLSKRTFWNPSNFKFFSREYQHIVFLFIWALEQKEWFLPQEMICSIFQFVGVFAFEYLLGRPVQTKNWKVVFCWDGPMPDFPSVNMKNYYHEVLKIKEAAKEIFHSGRGQAGELEFKSVVEYLLFQRSESFYRRSEELVQAHIDEFFTYISDRQPAAEEGEEGEGVPKTPKRVKRASGGVSRGEHQRQHHHGLITFVHHLKHELAYRLTEKDQKIEDVVKVMVDLADKTYKIESKRVVDRIKYERDSQGASRWRRPDPTIDWLSISGGHTKYFKTPTPAPENSIKKEEAWLKFFEFVKDLK